MIEFGMSRLLAKVNGIDSGCAITTGGVGATAVVASGAVFIGGTNVVVSAIDVDVSAVSPSNSTKYLFARIASGDTVTGTLDVTSVKPAEDVAILATFLTEAANITNINVNTGVQAFGRARTCSINMTYDSAVARGGSLIFPNDMKLYNGNIEGTLEYAEIDAKALGKVFGGDWASGGVGSGTLTITGTQAPRPFMIEAQQITNGVTATYTLLKCYSNSLAMTVSREDYTVPTLSFAAIANASGNIITIQG